MSGNPDGRLASQQADIVCRLAESLANTWNNSGHEPLEKAVGRLRITLARLHAAATAMEVALGLSSGWALDADLDDEEQLAFAVAQTKSDWGLTDDE